MDWGPPTPANDDYQFDSSDLERWADMYEESS